MKFSERTIFELKRVFKKLENDTFDEDDILNLLLQIRAVSKNHHLIWEFASFIAHPEERNQGVFQTSINVNYAKIKLQNEIRNGQSFNPCKIKKEVFKVLILDSLKLSPEIDIRTKTGFSKSECQKKIKEAYTNEGGFLIIKNPLKINEIWKLLNPIINTIRMGPVFQNSTILKQFKIVLGEITKKLKLDFNYKKFISEKGDSLLFCLMALINSSNFKCYDNETGTCNLKVSNDYESFRKNKNIFSLHLMADVKSEIKFSLGLNWSLMKLDNIEQFIPELNELKVDYYSNLKINKFNAIRNKENKLTLGEK
jgi:hypothetical protein